MSEWSIFAFVVIASVWIVWARLDRLGRQLEAVLVRILLELVRDEERRMEIVHERMEERKEEANEDRKFWTFWGIVGVLALGGAFITKQIFGVL